MTTSTLPRRRNLSLECCKLIAACFVVFIHVPFPQPAGDFVLCLARTAVPLFFAISGWYSYQTAPGKLLQRMGHMLLLELAGIAVMMLWRLGFTAYMGLDVRQMLLESLPGKEALLRWLVFNDDPFGGHLWYLSASAFAYGALWIYGCLVRGRWGYRPLYVLGTLLLLTHLAMGEFSRYTGLVVLFRNYRTGLLYGLPMMILGLYLREHRDVLGKWWTLPRLVLLLAGGIGLSLAEWKHFGVCDFYSGLVLTVSALLLMTDRYPGVPARLAGIASRCGPVSTLVYLVHLTVNDGYMAFVQWRVAMALPSWEAWIRPFGVLGLSLAAGVVWVWLAAGIKKLPTAEKGGKR